MAIQFPLNGQARLSQQDLDAYTKELAKQPKQLAVQELQKLIDAGEAQLPEGSGAKLRDMQWALQNDAWDPTQQTSGVKRPAPAAVSEIRVERERSMDGTQVAQQLRLVVQGRAEPGTAYEIVNLSRGGTPLASGAVAADGSFNYEGLLQPLFFNEQIGVRIRNQSTGARSETITQLPKSIEVQVKGQARESVELKIAQRQESPFVQQSLIQSTQKIATADAPAGIALAGKAGSVPAGAELQVILGDKVQTARAMLDGSFIFDVKGITPGQQVTLNVIDGGQVTTQQYNTVAVRFDTSGFTASTQGAPYDRLQKGVKDPAGPFLRFGGGNVDPGSIVTVTNYTTGAKFQAVADKDGRIELEISGVHTGDALGFECKDAAGNLSPNAVQNWPVPGAGSENARLKQLLCAQNLLTENVAELSTLIHKMPTSIHRKLVEDFLAGPAAKVVRDAADLQSLKKAFAEAYSGKNDIVTNISNPAPKEPIVVGARVIKPRIMDQGSPAGRDPIEVEGKAEPFSRVEIRNASMPGAPVIGTIQADKNGNFKFISRDESKFLHGDQLYVRSIDQGGAQSTDALAKTCAYELQIWTVQPREVLVELPHATHTRPPFLDMSKTKSESKPIGPKDKEQVHTISGAPGSSEPNAIVRVTNQRGKVFEAATNKDGSFQLNVGEITPGETLTAMVIDTNGITTQQMFQTPALRFDSGKLLSTSNGVPFQRFDGKGAPDSDGPFLRFAAEGAVNPHASVKVTNNSTGESFTVTASETGALDFEARRVHAGDSLSFVVTDPAGNVAPNAIENYVVPGTPQWTADVQALECQHNFASEDVQKALAIMAKAPTAANRAAFESMLKRPEAFLTKGDFEKLKEAFVGAYAAPNNVRNAAENPAPKPPIVLDADIIKPRIMDQGSAANRDPLEVRGKAEPYTTIEIRNASQPGYPVIGSVRTDKNGNFAFTSRDESKFLHGDQIILRATDQGGASSEATLATTCAYELRIWNNPPRSEKVKLEKTQDTRPPFLDQSKVPHSRVAIEKDSKQQIYRFTGNAGASEPFAMIRVTNKRGEAYETQVKKDGSFAVDVGNFEPGETLAMTIVDGNGQTMSTQFGTQALRFDPQAFTNTSEGVPYTRPAQSGTQQKDQAAERTGPFLRFAQDKAVDPFSYVVVKNNSTGQMFRAQADENGRLDLEIAGVHAGDSLSFAVQDPAGNKAPQTLINYVVPATPRPTPRLADIACQQTVLPQHITEAIALLDAAPTAANRALVENWINGEHTSFQQGASKAAIGEALERLYAGKNDVRSDASNPEPKAPIVLDARVIKPVVMDQGSVAGRDPLEVFGEAEPFTMVEIRNASVPGAPVIGSVRTDENGKYKFVSRDESKFLHGDQLLVRAVDQGNAASKNTLAKSCAYNLQIWNQTGRQELVRLPEHTDTRPPFIDMGKVTRAQTIATEKVPSTFTTLAGAALSAEPRSVVRVMSPQGKVLGETIVGDDGSFKLAVSGYVPGETLQVTALDAGAQVTTTSFATEALRFDGNALTARVDGPPYQKVASGSPEKGGPFLRFTAKQVAFPFAKVEVTNHATGVVTVMRADENGNIDHELAGVHAFDLLTFRCKDAAGNEAPNALRQWQVPAQSKNEIDPEIAGLTSQRPIANDVVELIIERMRKQPTPQHREIVTRLLREHPSWFIDDSQKALQAAVKEIYAGPPEIVPDATNPAPRRPIVLGAEIVKPRVMDAGNAPRDPLTVTGKAEPLSTIEIYNGSVPGRPLIGTVRTDENGVFNFQSTDESKFLHGDQIVVMSKDAGNATSSPTVSSARAFELRVWNQQNRREKVALEGTAADTRDPWLQAQLVKTERAAGTQQSATSFVLAGQKGSTEVFAEISVIVGSQTFKTEADVDGAWKLPVEALELGKPVEIVISDANKRQVKVQFTPAVAA